MTWIFEQLKYFIYQAMQENRSHNLAASMLNIVQLAKYSVVTP